MTTPRPLFFSDLVPFDTQVHRQLTLPVQRQGFAFAGQATLLPLTIAEVSVALQHYPIVFVVEGQTVALVAMTGLAGGRNQFVDASGEWRPGAYIPAYVRGYPFIAIRPSETAEPILAFDPNASDFKASGGQPLLSADGQPGEQLKGIMAFQSEYRHLAERTTLITQALKEAGVLEEGSLQLQASEKDSEAQKIGGFLIVSEAKLKAL
ncbi:MAG: SapC family protein, partial [Betaproteobacteria bacterium]